MRYIKMTILSAIIVMGLSAFTHAAQIPVVNVTGSGTYNNDVNLIIDGTIPAEYTGWTASTNVWWNGVEPNFKLDFGALYRLEDILVQVDNNDTYEVMYSTDNIGWSSLFLIGSGAGNVTWGMDTFYIQAEIGFTPVDARYIKLFSVGGDNSYALSEIQAFGTLTTAAPEPSSMLLLGLGLIGLAGIRRKFKK